MSIRKRPSKKAINGYTYQVYFPYKDSLGMTQQYIKSGFATKKEALAHEAQKRQELASFGDILINRTITFNEVFEEYMAVEGNLKYAHSTKQYYVATYKQFIKGSIGRAKVSVLKYKDIQQFFNNIDVGLSTAKNIKKIFNVTFNYAVKSEYVRESPMTHVHLYNELKPTEGKEMMTITKEELDSLIENIMIVDKHVPNFDYTQFNYYSYAVAIFIGWYTGLRVSETLGLQKKNIDFENNVISVENRLEYHGKKKDELYNTNKLKTKKSKAIIPMAAKLKEGLLIWFEKNPYETVICDINGEYIHPASFNARIRSVSKKIGLDDFHYHCLRHSFTSNLVRHDVSPKVTMELARHNNINTTMAIYAHLNNDYKREVVDKIFDE